jgi:hypothetical protein
MGGKRLDRCHMVVNENEYPIFFPSFLLHKRLQAYSTLNLMRLDDEKKSATLYSMGSRLYKSIFTDIKVHSRLSTKRRQIIIIPDFVPPPAVDTLMIKKYQFI